MLGNMPEQEIIIVPDITHLKQVSDFQINLSTFDMNGFMWEQRIYLNSKMSTWPIN